MHCVAHSAPFHLQRYDFYYFFTTFVSQVYQQKGMARQTKGLLEMKRFILTALTVIMTVCLAGCGKIKDISITSCDIVSISPSGLRSLNGVFLVGIHNPVFKFAVSDIQGTVYHKGTAIIDFTANGFEVQKKSDDKHRISGIAELRPEISLLSALALLKDLNADSYTVDVSARVKAEGIKMTISRKGMPLSSFME